MRALTSISTAALVAGCGGGDASRPDAEQCTTGDPIAVGLARTGAGGARVTLVAIAPDPPARFINNWAISATTPTGGVATAADVRVSTFMPEHGHGQSAPISITDGAAGTIDVTPLDLWMPSLWEVRFTVAGDGVTFRVCIRE
jgi:hypothetical protein